MGTTLGKWFERQMIKTHDCDQRASRASGKKKGQEVIYTMYKPLHHPYSCLLSPKRVQYSLRNNTRVHNIHYLCSIRGSLVYPN